MKKLLKIIVILVLIIAVAYLFKNLTTKRYTIEEKKQLILEELEKKYGREFIGYSYSPKGLLKNYEDYYLYPKGGVKSEEWFVARPYVNWRKFYVEDNFYGRLIKDDYEKVVRSELDKVFNNYNLELNMVGNSTRSVVLDQYTTLDQIYDKEVKWYRSQWRKFNDNLMMFSPEIHVQVSESSIINGDGGEAATRFIKAMAERKLVCYISIFVYKDNAFNDLDANIGKWIASYSIGINDNDLSLWDLNIRTH